MNLMVGKTYVLEHKRIHVRHGAERNRELSGQTKRLVFPWLSGLQQVTFLVKQQGRRKPWRRRWTNVYSSRPSGWKVAGSSSKTSWEKIAGGVAGGEREREPVIPPSVLVMGSEYKLKNHQGEWVIADLFFCDFGLYSFASFPDL